MTCSMIKCHMAYGRTQTSHAASNWNLSSPSFLQRVPEICNLKLFVIIINTLKGMRIELQPARIAFQSNKNIALKLFKVKSVSHQLFLSLWLCLWEISVHFNWALIWGRGREGMSDRENERHRETETERETKTVHFALRKCVCVNVRLERRIILKRENSRNG